MSDIVSRIYLKVGYVENLKCSSLKFNDLSIIISKFSSRRWSRDHKNKFK
jgi:hypothetical protein